MTTTIDRTKHPARHRAGPARVAVALLVVFLALPLTGCRDSGSGIDPAPLPAPTQEYIPPDDSSGFVDEPYVYPDEPNPYGDYTEEPYVYPDEPNPYGDYTDEPYLDPDEPGGGTDPCAFPGDLLCPQTRPTVPPPNLNPPF
jgi:hypothetical protein